MQRHLVVVLLALAPAALDAQGTLSFHTARGPDTGVPWLWGATVGARSHGLGLRLGGAVNSLVDLLDSDPDAPDPRWVADADVVLGGAGSGANPYFFLGAGLQSPAADDFSRDAITHWSWGGGISIPVFGPASLFGEARRRTFFDRARRSSIAPGSRASELRFGIGLDFGGSPSDHDRPRRRRGHGRY